MIEQNKSKQNSSRVIAGLSDVIDRYDAVLLDAWGVIHDGASLYPDVLDCLEKLHDKKIPVIIISNAARRVEIVRNEIIRLGAPGHLLSGVVSSGEMVWRGLHDRSLPAQYLGERCFYLGPQRSRSILDGLALVETKEIGSADVILLTGASGRLDTLEDDAPILRDAAKRNIPMICANPDLTAIRGGIEGISAGSLASYYEQLGAMSVLWVGKPWAAIYRQALDLLGNIPQSRVLAVGDAMRTDIKGARNAGLDSLLVAGGIHRDELHNLDHGTLDCFFRKHGDNAEFVVQILRW